MEGMTGLHLAAKRGHSAVAKLLIEYGANVQALTSIGLTPLHIAAHNGHIDTAEILIQNGVDVQALGVFPSHFATTEVSQLSHRRG
jgi:ankyrin repeat protein